LNSSPLISCASCGCLTDSCADCANPMLCSNCVSCCCSLAHGAWRKARAVTGLRLEYLSLGWMGAEVIASIVAGILAGSLALIAFGGDSLVEMLSAFVVARHLKDDLKGSPRSGKGVAMLSSLLLASLVPLIGLGTVYSFFTGIRSGPSPLGIAVATASLLMMPYLWHRKKNIGDEIKCLPLRIDSAESATCFLMSAALMLGLIARWILGLWWTDYVATAVILSFISLEAYESFRATSRLEETLADMKAQVPSSPRV